MLYYYIASKKNFAVKGFAFDYRNFLTSYMAYLLTLKKKIIFRIKIKGKHFSFLPNIRHATIMQHYADKVPKFSVEIVPLVPKYSL